MNKHVYQAPQDRGGIVGLPVGSLAEKVRQNRYHAAGLLEFINNPANEHRFPFAGITLDPQNRAAFGTTPFSKLGILQNPGVRILKQAASVFLNALLVVMGVTQTNVSDTPVLGSECGIEGVPRKHSMT